MADVRYTLHTVKIHPDSASAVIIRDLLSAQLQLAPNVVAEVTAANITPDHVAMHGQQQRLTFDTYDVPGVLDAIGVTGLGITGATNPGVVLYLQKFDQTGGATSGSVARTYTAGTGLLVPKSMSCEHGGDLKITSELAILWDRTNNPIVLAENGALPSITQTPGRWTLGPITIAGNVLGQYTNVAVDFGNQVTTRGIGSDVYDTVVEQKTHAPKITITGIDPLWFKASGGIPIGGAVVANGTDSIVFRKRAQTGSHFVSNATSAHIKLTLAGFAAIDGAAQLQAQRIDETTIQITGAKDSSGNMPIVLSTASSYS